MTLTAKLEKDDIYEALTLWLATKSKRPTDGVQCLNAYFSGYGAINIAVEDLPAATRQPLAEAPPAQAGDSDDRWRRI